MVLRSGPNHGMWKGDRVGLGALHDWIRVRIPKPDKCQCGSTGPLDLHNIDKKYTRDLTKWVYLCKKCHAKVEKPAREACHSPEAIRKRSESLKGHTVSETTRAKLSVSKKRSWKKVTPEEKKRILQKITEGKLRTQQRKPRITIKCGCGCGADIITPDDHARERKFIAGHNPGFRNKIRRKGGK